MMILLSLLTYEEKEMILFYTLLNDKYMTYYQYYVSLMGNLLPVCLGDMYNSIFDILHG